MLTSKDILEHFLKMGTLDFISKYIVQDVQITHLLPFKVVICILFKVLIQGHPVYTRKNKEY